ncbi:MAG: ribonuclease J, partial [Eggerthellaceae bacterium]|nr:ribonuclease J [Eggerthellaceae bacterium]
HGHEDHTGCLPYLLKDLDNEVGIYGTDITLGLVEVKLKEFNIKNAKLVEIKAGQSIKLGCFDIEFFAVNHSIPGSVGAFFKTPAGNVLHTGDFKLDQTPIDGIRTDFAALARFGEMGVDLMLSDSTNADKSQFTPSEALVGITLRDIISKAKGRVIIASFASHIHRMQQICDAAIACGRKVVVTGRSMIQNTDIARKLGYLNIADNDLIDAYELNGYPANKVVVMCTGSQGEPLSALARIASGEHKTITIEEGDTAIVSATPVPGNEKSVTRVINQLSKMGIDVYDKNRALVHVSGHASAEELKIVLSLVNPVAFMPVHGEALHLRAHALLAQSVGIAKENIFICENGESLLLENGKAALGERVESGVVYVDGLSVGDTSQEVLDQRFDLGSMGCAVVSFAIDTRTNTLAGDVNIEMRGIAGEDDKELIYGVSQSVANAISRGLDKGMTYTEIKKTSRDALLSLLWETTKQRPYVIVSLLPVAFR